MRQMRASRATLASRGFITRAASALIFVGASALTLALPGDASENHGLTPSLSEWQNAGAPAPSEHWLGNDVGSFRLTGGDRLHDRILRTLQNRVHQEPERAAKELHGLIVGGSEGRDKLRQMLLNAAENKEMVTPLDIDNWWKSYYDRYLLDLADSSLNELLRYGEERMEARLGFVRNVNLEYRSPLGGRTGSGALSFLGAVSEYHDSALVWHLRAYHNEDKDTGGNIGFIYRRAYDGANLIAGRPALVGGNVYLDYQGHDAGEFLRYSLGGEVRTGAVDLYANYYIPLTDRQVYNGRTYYTAEGFDVEANVGVPGADWASAILGYYWFDDDDGRDPEGEQKGTKVGFRLRPTYEWEFELNYDIPEGNGNEEVGGRFSFNKRIGENADRHSSRPYGGDFNPRNHFFDIPRREYSQRIRSYGVAAMADDPRLWWANPGTFENAGGITDVNIAGAVVVNNAGVAEIAGVPVTGAFLVTAIADVVTATVQVNGGADGERAAFVLGRVDNGPGEVTVELIRGGGGALYVFDLDIGQVSVQHGAMVWDSIASPSWLNQFASGEIVVELSGTALSVNVPSDGAVMDAFALYEGSALFVGGTENDGSAGQAALDCTSRDFAIPGAGRDPAGSFVTECYGDIAIVAAGGMEFNGQSVADEDEIPVFENAVVVVGNSGAQFLMRAGRDDHESAPVEILAAATTLQVLNDADNNIRYVQGENFSIGGTRVYCDPTSGDVAVSSGRAVGYCLEGLNTYLTDSVSNLTPRAGAVNEEIIDLSKIAKVPNDVRILGVSGGGGDPSGAFEMRPSGTGNGAGLFASQALEPGATYEVQLEIYLGGSSPVLHNLQVSVGGNANVDPAGVGSAFTSGNIKTATQLAAHALSYALVGDEKGLAIDAASGVISGPKTGLVEGANEVMVQTEPATNPPANGIPGGNYRQTQPLQVHLLGNAEVIALINRVEADAFPNGNQVKAISGLRLADDAQFVAGTAVSVALDADGIVSFASNVMSLATEGDNEINTMLTTAENVVGLPHALVVNVRAVDRIVIPPSRMVPSGDQNLGALADFTGAVSWQEAPAAGTGGEVNLSYEIVGGADQTDFSVNSSGELRLSGALGAGGEKVVVVAITHMPTGALTTRLLQEFGGWPDPNQDPANGGNGIEDAVVEVRVVLRTADIALAQTGQEDGRSANPITGVSFTPPAVAGGIPDFATGGTWTGAPGQGTEGWATIGSDGVVSGTPPDDARDEYTDTLNATFSHPMLSGEPAVALDVLVVDRIPAAATVTFTPAGTNGSIAVRVTRSGEGGDGSVTLFTESPAVANFGDGIEVLAIPDPGYYVATWTNTGTDDSGCVANGPTGKTGGTRACAFAVPAVDDGDYEVGATFAEGAIAPNLPETGDVGATDYAGWVSCLAFGGSLLSDAASDSCTAYTADSDSAANCALSPANLANCQGVFNAVRDCNNDRQPATTATAASDSVTCGSTCGAGQIAVGGSCVDPAGARVNYSQPEVEVYRIDGSRVASGENVAAGALLSATATPPADTFVAGWSVDCVNSSSSDVVTAPLLRFSAPDQSNGSIDDADPKFCLTQVTMNVDLSAVMLEVSSYPTPPADAAGYLALSDAERETLCMGLGGVFTPDLIIGFSLGSGASVCYGFTELVPDLTDTNTIELCTMSNDDFNLVPPTCPNFLSTARECYAQGRVVQDLSAAGSTAALCGGVCQTGRPLGGNCVQSLVGKGRFIIVSEPVPIEDDSEAVPALQKKKEAGKKIRRSIGNSLSFPALPRQVGLPEQHEAGHRLDPEIEKDTLTGSRAECEALGGMFNPAGPGFCLGVAAGIPACSINGSCVGLFNRIKRCHQEDNQRGGSFSGCGSVCGNGLTAFGNRCVYQTGGVVPDDVTEGVLPNLSDGASFPLPPNATGSRAECEALGGMFNPAGPGFCLGVAAGIPACSINGSCVGLFNRIARCHLEGNEEGGSFSGCGNACEYGAVARGIECVAPPPGGIQIGDPDNGVLRSTSHQDLVPGNNPLAEAEVVVLVATPTVGYHVLEWTGDCASGGAGAGAAGGAEGTVDPFRNTPQTCTVVKGEGALDVGVVISLGVLPDAVPVDGDIPDVPATLQAACGALGGSGVEVTLGVEYCYGYAEQEATLRDDDPPASVEGIGIKTQCWVAQGSYADTTRTDTVPDSTDTQMSVFDTFGGNRQLCRNALTHVRDCNKMNRPGLNNLETFRVDTSVVCPSSASSTGPEYCLPDNAGPGTGGTPNEMVCGAACGTDPVSGEQLLAVGGRCIPPGMVNNLPLYLTNL